MIKVKVNKINNHINKIEVTGHAMYDDFGKDIVCSSVSSIIITTVNGIDSLDNTYMNTKYIKDGLNIDIIKKDNTCDILINNMLDLLSELESNYPNNIKIIEGGK